MQAINRRQFLSTALLSPALLAAKRRAGRPGLLFAGTYTEHGSKGIYTFGFDESSGELTARGLAAETPNPTFLALSPDRRTLFAINEVTRFQGQPSGSVTSFAIHPVSAALTPVNTVSSHGTGPCHVAVDRTGHAVFAANYAGGSAASFAVDSGGRLSEAVSAFQYTGHGFNPKRQEAPHAHCTTVAPGNRFVLVNDLGLDHILVYRLNPMTAKLVLNTAPVWTAKPGSGPRHLAFHPNRNVAYCICEMASTIYVLAWDGARGSLASVQNISTLPAGFTGFSTGAEVAVDAAGRFVYASNRGHDSIAVFAVDGADGRLSLVQHVPSGGRTPRNFTLDPSGRWLLAANQDSGNIVVFARDPGTGRLKPTGQTLPLDGAVCLVFS